MDTNLPVGNPPASDQPDPASNGIPTATPPVHALEMQGPEISGKTVHSPKLETAFNQSVDNPISFIDAILQEAIRLAASDLLFEPMPTSVVVRVRIDGALYRLGEFNRDYYSGILARLKILSHLDSTEKRKVQEGQFSLDDGGKVINLRVEIIQTIHDELVVIRVLQMSSVVMELSQLGFTPTALQLYEDILSQRSGLIMVCGPTGSGKTTTLYSTITSINRDFEYNVMTIEDPVEYQLRGVNQIPVREDIGLTFGAGLRSILRLTPDIILVGEIRDRETAITAVESGLTGHMVFSTIHAPDVVGVIYRLLDLGIESYLINSSLRGILSQRLVRRNCPKCLTAYVPNQDEVNLFQKHLGRVPPQLYKSQGCDECQNLGYSGRCAIYEIVKMNTQVRNLIRNQQSEDELRRYLIQNGLVTLLVDGLLKCEAGITNVEEVIRNSLRVD